MPQACARVTGPPTRSSSDRLASLRSSDSSGSPRYQSTDER